MMIGMNLTLEDIEKAMKHLLAAFVWEQSNEGHKYWSDVFDKLEHYRNLAKDESNG